MLSSRLAHPTASLGARVLPALAATVAIFAFGAAAAEAPAGAETSYLAFAAGVVLLSAAAVAPRPGLEIAAGALLVTVAAWALPDGPARGAVAMALAAGTLAVAAARWLGRVAEERSLPALGVVGLALGLQALLRGAELLHAGSPLRAVALFVAFPAVGALAVLGIGRAFGRWPALLAGGAAVLMAPGFRPASLAALVALAAAPWLCGSPAPGRPLADRRIALGARIAAALLLAAPFAWDLRAALVAAAAGIAAALAVAEEPGPGWRPWLAPAVAALALVLLALGAGRPAPEVIALVALAVLAVPVIVVTGPERAAAALAALLLAVAAARGVTVEGALAAPVALAALAVAPGPARDRGTLFVAQGAWLAAALGLGSLLGAYPWLRAEPFPELLPLLGVGPTPIFVLVAVLAMVGLAALGARSERRHEASSHQGDRGGRAARVTGWATAGVIAAALVVRIPAAGTPRIDRHPVILDAERPVFSAPGGGVAEPVASLVLDSSLANSAALPAGTPVATVRLRHADGAETAWVLRAGVETGEWAADRPDLAASELVVPDPWLSWVAEEEGFFGRRYRSVRRLAQPAPVERIAIELRDDLPEDVSLTLFHLEPRP